MIRWHKLQQARGHRVAQRWAQGQAGGTAPITGLEESEMMDNNRKRSLDLKLTITDEALLKFLVDLGAAIGGSGADWCSEPTVLHYDDDRRVISETAPKNLTLDQIKVGQNWAFAVTLTDGSRKMFGWNTMKSMLERPECTLRATYLWDYIDFNRRELQELLHLFLFKRELQRERAVA